MSYERPLRAGDHIVEIVRPQKGGVEIHSSFHDPENPDKKPHIGHDDSYFSAWVMNATNRLTYGAFIVTQKVMGITALVSAVGMSADTIAQRVNPSTGLAGASVLTITGVTFYGMAKALEGNFRRENNIGKALSEGRKSGKPKHRQVFPQDPNLFY